MWQPSHSRLPRSRAGRGSFLGPLLCLLTVLSLGVFIGRMTAGEEGPGLRLDSTAPPAAGQAASPAPAPRATGRSVERIARERALSETRTRRSAPSPAPGGQIPGDYGGGPAVVSGAEVPSLSTPLAGRAVRLANEARRRRGCAPLRVDSRLTRSAGEHALEMARSGQFTHDSPNGASPWERMGRAGYDAGAAENIGQGYRSAEEAMRAWLTSPAHRGHILNCGIVAIGVGVAEGSGGPWWTQDFGYR